MGVTRWARFLRRGRALAGDGPFCDLPQPKDSPRQLFDKTPLTSKSTSV